MSTTTNKKSRLGQLLERHNNVCRNPEGALTDDELRELQSELEKLELIAIDINDEPLRCWATIIKYNIESCIYARQSKH